MWEWLGECSSVALPADERDESDERELADDLHGSGDMHDMTCMAVADASSAMPA
jgi:hypothetical protein